MIHYDPGKMPSRCFVQSNVLLSIALENYYRQREIFRLYEERRLFSITDVLTGLLNFESGKVLVNGISPRDVKSRRYIGYSPEQPYFYDYLTGRELLRFYGTLVGLDGAELDAARWHCAGDSRQAETSDSRRADERA